MEIEIKIKSSEKSYIRGTFKIERVPNQGEDFWIDNICHEVVGVSTIYKGNNSWYYDVILKTK